MVRKLVLAQFCLVVLGLLQSTARAAEVKDNQEYLGWAKFKPGSIVVYTAEMDMGGLKVAVENTVKLIEVKADKLVLETVSSSNIGGQVRTKPAKQRDVPAKKEQTGEVKDAGEEDVEVAGKKIHCKVKEGTGDSPFAQGQAQGKGKVYMNETVPGHLVKMVLTSDKGSMTILVKSFDAK